MRIILAGTAIAALVTGVFWVRPAPLAKIDDSVYDLLTGLAGRGNSSGQVAIVEIDEASLAAFGRWPWPRDLVGLMVRRILDSGAATVVLDTMLNTEDLGPHSALAEREKIGPAEATNDEVLAGVLRGNPVVAGYAFRFDKVASNPAACELQPLPVAVAGPAGSWRAAFFHPTGVLCDVPEISQAVAATGFLNAAADSDGKVRGMPLVMEYGDREFPSLALAAFKVYRHVSAIQLNLNAREASGLRLDTAAVHLEGRSFMRLRFRGGRRTFPYIAATSVVGGGAPLEMLRGKIVIVGGSAVGMPNPVATPVDPQFPDVEVEATAIDNLLQGDSFYRPAGGYLWELLLAVVAGVGATFLLVSARAWLSVLIIAGCVAGMWVGCALLLSSTGLLFSPLPSTAMVMFTLPVVTLLGYWREKRHTERTQGQLAAERGKALEVLRDSESRYQRLVENINDAIIVDDEQGRLVFANSRFQEWFGLEAENVSGAVLENWVAPEWRATLRDLRNRLIRGERTPDHCEYEGIRKDGSRIWIEALITTVVRDGRIVGTQSALRDVTQRKQIEAQYLQAQKMESIGRLAGGVAHDFNNLLQVINGYTDLLLTRRPDEEQYRTELEAIRSAGERAADLTRNLLTFSRKEQAKPTVLDLNAVVADAGKMLVRLIGEDIELITRLSPRPGFVIADSSQAYQILMNLTVNARDAMPHGGQVVIETKNVEPDEDFVRRHPDFERISWVYLGFTDTGSGMSEDVKRHLFEPFFTTKNPGKGTGLGLATIYGIVQQSSGRIEVTSRPGEGTTFHLFLPRTTSEGQLANTSKTGPVMKGSETVLVVEDQEAVRQYLRAVLERSGYRVLEAGNGLDALALVKRFDQTIHLIVTDLVMPLMNGLDLTEQVKITRPGTKVLFISGYANETIDDRGIDEPDLVYLQKPFDSEQLIAKVQEVLRHR